jgi:3-hydroxybutyryl-CoA dehydrogenase
MSEQWTLPPDAPVAVVGAGLMGHAIAAIFSSQGFAVTCVEPDDETRRSLDARMHEVLRQLNAVTPAAQAVTVIEHVSQLDRSTPLVIEAAPELLALKQDLLREVAETCPSAVIATNSSVYRVSDVGALVEDRSRVLGTHWWNPPHLMPLVEVIQGADTNPTAVQGMITLLASLGKTPVHVQKDTPGFIGNRLQHAMWREAMALVQEGICDVEAVDVVARNTLGLRLSAIGPIENADYVGLDLTLSIHEYVFPALSTAQEPLEVLQDAVRHGRLGAKTGSGLLCWSEGRREETKRRIDERLKVLLALQ